MTRFPFLVVAAVALVRCDRRDGVRSAQAITIDSMTEEMRRDSIVRARPGYVVDSILPVEEEIRRFQATIPTRPEAFTNGATTRSGLVRRFVRALERNDTTALAQLVIDRAEFGYLIYPTSPNAAPPYRQSPNLVWMARAASNDKSLTRLFGRFGGKPLGYLGLTCPDSVERESGNTLWKGCVVRFAPTARGTSRLRLFGAIVERGGQYKFLSLTNGL